MSRRAKGLLEEIAELPWWGGVVMAALVYLLARFGSVAFLSDNRSLQPLGNAISQLAWAFSIPFLIAAAVSATRAHVRGRLIDRQVSLAALRGISWSEFELLVGEYFRRQGYDVQEIGGGGPDGGIDLLLRKDGRKAVVQCKRWKSRQVGVTVIRELYGVMTAERADEAILISSGTYTPDARTFAQGKPIRLVDGPALLGMIGEVQTGHVQRKAEPTITPTCPKCASPMVRRLARSGPNAGNEFWGCSTFPKCRGVRPIP